MATAMSAGDPRPARKRARFETILAAAWEVANEQGLAGVSLHEVARRVGLRQPSLYAYIDSKNGLYDAMFAQAGRLMHEMVFGGEGRPEDPRQAVRAGARAMLGFMSSNPAEAQLLLTRTIPGFEPSSASYAVAQAFQAEGEAMLAMAGVTEPSDVDIYTALIAGLGAQQQANDPGGNRWNRHVDSVLDMFFDWIDHKPTPSRPIGGDPDNATSPTPAKRSSTSRPRRRPAPRPNQGGSP